MIRKLILIITFFTGLSILLYPSISQYWNSYTQSRSISEYNKILKNNNSLYYSTLLESANAYNKALADLEFPLIEYKKLNNYNNILNVNNKGMIGYISIAKLNIELPIYHSTSSSVLNVAVGHLEGSSLPIGGNSTHSVLSAHRGLPSAKLFTDLNKLEIGDTFTITILNEELTYQVDKIVIVEPDDISSLNIVKDKDYVTLMTCTPYGINTHRLLVRGTRIDNIAKLNISVINEASRIDNSLVAVLLTLIIIFILVIILKFKKREGVCYEENINNYNAYDNGFNKSN